MICNLYFTILLRSQNQSAYKKAKNLNDSFDSYKAAYGSITPHAEATPIRTNFTKNIEAAAGRFFASQ